MADDCCSGAWSKAAVAGELDAVDSWYCPNCGLTWAPEAVGAAVRHWKPAPYIEVFSIAPRTP